MSDESGTNEIYIRSFPDPGVQTLVDSEPQRLLMVTNFFEELRQVLPD